MSIIGDLESGCVAGAEVFVLGAAAYKQWLEWPEMPSVMSHDRRHYKGVPVVLCSPDCGLSSTFIEVHARDWNGVATVQLVRP